VAGGGRLFFFKGGTEPAAKWQAVAGGGRRCGFSRFMKKEATYWSGGSPKTVPLFLISIKRRRRYSSIAPAA
jgi:hypothetical protein